MALSADALTTWERAQAVLGLNASEQTKAEFLIDAASMYANRRSGRLLKARSVDLQLDGNGGSVLVLPQAPATISKLWLDATRAFVDGAELPAAEFHVLSDAGVIRLFSTTFPSGYATVRFVGVLGFETIPQDLEQAVLECVAANLRRLSSPGAIGLKNVSVDGATSSAYEVDWPTTAIMVFDSYRRPQL